jgi:hypothetical protein
MKYLILFCFITLSSTLSAQFYMVRGETVAAAAEKKLIVVLKSDADDYSAVLNAEQKAQYAGFDSKYNEIVRSVLPKFWNFTKGEIKYVNSGSVDSIPMADRENYLYLESGWDKKESATQGDFSLYSFDLSQIKGGKKSLLFTIAYLPDSVFTSADLIFFLKVFNNHMHISRTNSTYKESNNVEKNIEAVKSKTLLLNTSQTEMTNEDMKSDYDYKGEVVSQSRIESEIENESDSFLFIKLVWSPGLAMVAFDAFDTKTCTIVAVLGTGGVSASIGSPKYTWKQQSKTLSEQRFDPFPKYEYVPNPYYDKDLKIRLFKSKLKIKKSHLGLMDSKMAQKFNFR